MAQLVSVCRSDDYPYERRQIPLVVDDNLTMVVQFADTCVGCDQVGIKQKDLDRFVQRFNVLTNDEIAVALMVTSKEIFSLLSQLVPCVGCRRSVERLFGQLVDSGYPAVEPLVVTRNSVLSIKREYLFDPKAIYALFYIHGSKLNTMMEAIPKSKKNKRCMLHSLDSHKQKSLGTWMDIWDVLSQECREEVVLIECDSLVDTLENYLRKHRFCSECKSKVLRAYSILIGDLDCNAEKGYCPALYEGLRCCPGERHVHVLCKTDFIAHLIGRAEPELTGSRRERHAKTLDIAQEEVLTCLGIHLYERLHRIWQKLRAEEQTWQILFYLGVDALKKNFEVGLEKKQGISNLELMCQELLEEEQAKEQRKEQKRQKKKKKKGGKPQTNSKPSELLVIDDDDDDQEKNKENCKCDENTNVTSSTNSVCTNCDDHNSNRISVADLELPQCRSCDLAQNRKNKDRGGGDTGGGGSHGNNKNLNRNVIVNGVNGNRGSDCGYSSELEGCDSCSVPSSQDGSDVACSEGICNHDGDSPLCHRPDLPDTMCQDCLKSSAGRHGQSTKHRCSSPVTHEGSKLRERSTPSPVDENGSSNPAKFGMMLTLQDMLESSCYSGEDEDVISEEEIKRFKANQQVLNSQREELRETLRQRFANMQQRGGGGTSNGGGGTTTPENGKSGKNGKLLLPSSGDVVQHVMDNVTKLSMN